MNKRFALVLVAVFLTALTGTLLMTRPPSIVKASDHDDGETDIKTKNTNITDVYVMREVDLNPSNLAGKNNAGTNLIMAMYVNPRSIARQQYFFNEHCFYTFHITAQGPGTNLATTKNGTAIAGPSAVGENDAAAGAGNLLNRGAETLRMKFQFSGQNAKAGSQSISAQIVPVVTTLNANKAPIAVTEGNPTVVTNFGQISPEPPGLGSGGTPVFVNGVVTPTLGTPGQNAAKPNFQPPIINNLIFNPATVTGLAGASNANQTVNVFAGLREDTFTFDVNQFFRVRAALLGVGPAGTSAAFRTHTANATGAVDFPKDFNVLAIVLRVPLAAIQTVNTDQVFDVYATVDRFQ